MAECKLCRSQTIAVQCAKLYWHCLECELIFLDPGGYLQPSKEKERYMTHNNNLANHGYVRMFEDFLSFVQPYLLPGGRALDFGCGPGPVLAQLLAERGWHVLTYDSFFQPDRDFTQQQFELITATEVVEHLHNPLRELRMLSDLLVPGGALALMTHLHPGVEQFCTWWYVRDPTHVVFFAPQTFRWLARELNLHVVATDHRKSLVLIKRC